MAEHKEENGGKGNGGGVFGHGQRHGVLGNGGGIFSLDDEGSNLLQVRRAIRVLEGVRSGTIEVEKLRKEIDDAHRILLKATTAEPNLTIKSYAALSTIGSGLALVPISGSIDHFEIAGAQPPGAVAHFSVEASGHQVTVTFGNGEFSVSVLNGQFEEVTSTDPQFPHVYVMQDSGAITSADLATKGTIQSVHYSGRAYVKFHFVPRNG